MTKRINRRSFLKKAGSTALGATAFTLSRPVLDAEAESTISFRSDWSRNISRPWPGPEYWANPLQDWRIHNGRLECITAGGDRNVAFLTREVAQRSGTLTMSVRLGQINPGPLDRGFAGFRVGIKSPMNDYRAAAIYGRGMNAGIHADGRLFIGELADSAPKVDPSQDWHLELDARPSESGYSVILRATSIRGGHSAQTKRNVPADWLAGGLALVCTSAPVTSTPVPQEPIKDFSFYPPQQQLGGKMRFWFADWTVGGSKVDQHDDRAYGPILFTLYTVSRGILKLSAQFPPLEDTSSPTTLQFRDQKGTWKSIASANLDGDAWNATFRIPEWDATRERSFRVLYSLQDWNGGSRQYSYSGVIRKEPADKQEIAVRRR